MSDLCVNINDVEEKEQEEEHCTICTDVYEKGDLKTIRFGCNHVFHSTCLLEWWEIGRNDNTSRCPQCRQHVLVWPKEKYRRGVAAWDQADFHIRGDRPGSWAVSTYICFLLLSIMAVSFGLHCYAAREQVDLNTTQRELSNSTLYIDRFGADFPSLMPAVDGLQFFLSWLFSTLSAKQPIISYILYIFVTICRVFVSLITLVGYTPPDAIIELGSCIFRLLVAFGICLSPGSNCPSVYEIFNDTASSEFQSNLYIYYYYISAILFCFGVGCILDGAHKMMRGFQF